MEVSSPARERFARLVSAPGEAVDLVRCALAVAEEEYPDLDAEAYVEALDEMGRTARKRVRPAPTRLAAIRRLNALLFEDLGFTGNDDAYYDPRNSFLNDVLDRRTGVPLTLSIVYLEVGRRAGMDLHGVPFPGHFLVKAPLGDDDAVVDPFHGGELLDEDACRRRLMQATRGRVSYDPSLLRTAGPREMLVRLLSNLKAIYVTADDAIRALGAVDRILLCEPGRVSEVRDRGLLYEKLGGHAAAVRELERYLSLAGAAEDAAMIRRLVERMKARTVYEN